MPQTRKRKRLGNAGGALPQQVFDIGHIDPFVQSAAEHYAKQTGISRTKAAKNIKRSIRALLDVMKPGEEIGIPFSSLEEEGILKKLTKTTFSITGNP